jgi:hypothetical protein
LTLPSPAEAERSALALFLARREARRARHS